MVELQKSWNQRCDGEVIGARMCEHGVTLRDRRVSHRNTLIDKCEEVIARM